MEWPFKKSANKHEKGRTKTACKAGVPTQVDARSKGVLRKSEINSRNDMSIVLLLFRLFSFVHEFLLSFLPDMTHLDSPDGLDQDNSDSGVSTPDPATKPKKVIYEVIV